MKGLEVDSEDWLVGRYFEVVLEESTRRGTSAERTGEVGVETSAVYAVDDGRVTRETTPRGSRKEGGGIRVLEGGQDPQDQVAGTKVLGRNQKRRST